MEKSRCEWCVGSEIERNYHDNEWGVVVYEDKKLFEFLLLDAFQAGLSWKTILIKRENFRQAFDNFDLNKIANYDDDKIAELMNNAGIIRNKLKINSTIANARLVLELQSKYGEFSKYIWQFTDGKQKVNHWNSKKEVPATSIESDNMSKALKKIGFKFVGSTICYSFMQAAGMVNDHEISCYRHSETLIN